MDRLRGLDLLRAIAILWVMLFHAWSQHLNLPLVSLSRFGWMGVDLFFVLSGYLIGSQLLKAYQQGRPLDFGAFYWRRVLRVVPAFWVTLAIYFLVPTLAEEKSIESLWKFLTFTLNFFINYQDHRSFTHAWSLCVEEHFYLVFPFLAAWLVKNPSQKKTCIFIIATILFGIAIRAYLWQQLDDSKMTSLGISFGTRYFEQIYFPTYCRLDGILAGVVVAVIRIFRPDLWAIALRKPNYILLTGLLALACSLVLFADRQSFVASVFGFPLLSIAFALLVTVAANPQSALAKIYVPLAKATALLAYSLYLSHCLANQAVKTFFPDLVADGGFSAMLVYAIASYLFAAVLYFVVERPFLRLRDRVFSSHR